MFIPVMNNAWSEAEYDRAIHASAPTIALRAKRIQSIAVTANTITSWTSRVGTISFAQLTAVNRPKITRGDNLENRCLYSVDATNWSFLGATELNNLVTASAGTSVHRFRQNTGGTVAGQVYVFEVDLTYGNHQYVIIGEDNDAAVHLAVLDLVNGVVGTQTNCTATIETISAGRYKATLTYTRTNTSNNQINVAFGTAINNTTILSWNAAGTETFTFNSGSFRSALADPTHLLTTSAQEYKGVNGRPAAHFDGIDDYMSSVSALSDIMANNAKTFIGVVKPLLLSAAKAYLGQSNGDYFMPGSGYAANTAGVKHFDGVLDTINFAAVLNNTHVLSSTHDGTNLEGRLNNGAKTSTASGNTSSLAGTLLLGTRGGTADYFMAGPITDLLTWNKVLHPQTIDKLTRLAAKERGASLR